MVLLRSLLMPAMRPQEILSNTAHRPYPIDDGPWVLYQSWRNVIFMHWPLSPDILLPYLPKHPRLKVDTYDGAAWLSLVLFTVSRFHLRMLPPVPDVSSFAEMNLRTYVTDGNKHGTLFLDIYADKLLPVLFHRIAGLPYHRAHLRAKEWSALYTEDHGNTGNLVHLKWSPASGSYIKSHLDRWLTDRYCTYQQNGSNLFRFPIHHADWPMQSVNVDDAFVSFRWKDVTLTTGGMELLHYSPGVDTLFWMKQKLH